MLITFLEHLNALYIGAELPYIDEVITLLKIQWT